MPSLPLGRFQRIETLVHERYREAQALRRRKEALENEIETLRDRIDLLGHVGTALQVLYDRVVEQETRFVTDMVSQGLRSVFYDQQLSLKADFHVSGGRVGVNLTLQREMEDGAVIEGDPLSTFGGGPVSLVSVLLRVVVLLKSKKTPFLLLDETVAPVSAEYVEPCARFLRELAEKLNLDILLVIHKPEYHEQAHTSYYGSEAANDGKTSLKVRKDARLLSKPTCLDGRRLGSGTFSWVFRVSSRAIRAEVASRRPPSTWPSTSR